MSLLALGAVLSEIADWVLVDGNLETNPLDALDQAIREQCADFLAMTVMPGPQLKQAVPVSRELKRRFPNLQIVWGGYFPTQHWEVALSAPYVDWVVRGHGELVFREFLQRWSADREIASLPGLAYRVPGGPPVTSSMAPIPLPDTLPDFPYDRINLSDYVRSTVLGSRTLSHHSSYGCPFFCNFCAVVNMVNGAWKPQSAARVAAIADYYVKNARINALEFFDNNFFVHESRVREFSDRIAHLNLGWWGEGRIDTMMRFGDQTWKSMANSGLKMVFMGAESGSDETLKRMDKGGKMSTDKTLAMAELMGTYGIVPEFSFVLGNPPDPEADAEGTMQFIKKVKQVNPRSEIIMYMYTPVPLAGELYDQARSHGFSFPETLEGWCDPSWEEFSQRRSSATPWVKDDLRQRVRNFERVLNAYYPTSTNPRLRGIKTGILRTVSGWRWATGTYKYPLELRALHKVFAYQRPETTGF
jgi:radical SAM superfamily enzyme YgiQ (UPF0313 family)